MLEATPCTQFFEVCDIYNVRNEIVHRGHLPVGWNRPDTWFIAVRPLGPVSEWFASQPDGDLTEVDAGIAALPSPPARSGK